MAMVGDSDSKVEHMTAERDSQLILYSPDMKACMCQWLECVGNKPNCQKV